jgi:hypothetical protein
MALTQEQEREHLRRSVERLRHAAERLHRELSTGQMLPSPEAINGVLAAVEARNATGRDFFSGAVSPLGSVR